MFKITFHAPDDLLAAAPYRRVGRLTILKIITIFFIKHIFVFLLIFMRIPSLHTGVGDSEDGSRTGYQYNMWVEEAGRI